MANRAILKKDGRGILFDGQLMSAIADFGQNHLGLIRQHPLFNDKNRRAKLNALIERPARKLNKKDRKIQEAMDAVNKAMDNDAQLLEQGYDPNNPEHRKLFSKIDKNILTSVINYIGNSKGGVLSVPQV